jgi:hypothetical protein
MARVRSGVQAGSRCAAAAVVGGAGGAGVRGERLQVDQGETPMPMPVKEGKGRE